MLAVLFSAQLLLAQATAAPSPDAGDLAARITAAVTQRLTTEGSPSTAIAVVRDGTLIYARAFGYRNVASDTPADPETQYEIGSVTKQFTAAAILQLKEAGRLSLDDRLAAYVPSFPYAEQITLRQLLNQTSGLPNYTDAKNFVAIAQEPGDLARIEGMIAEHPLHFAPGSKWEYSNSNYIALGRVVEVVSGLPYERYVRAHLFAPAGMTHSAMIADERSLSDFATPYWHGEKNTAPLAPSPMFGDVWAAGAGAIVSTVGDLAKWDLALASGKIVTAADFALMQTPGTLANGTPTNYGFGWMIDKIDGHERIWHNGGTFGSSSSNITFPRDHLDVIVLQNLAYAPTSGIADAVFETIFPDAAAAARTASAGEDPAVTARAKRVIGEALTASIPSSELSPKVAKLLTPALQKSVERQLSTLGGVQDVIFKQRVVQGDDTTYLYRVDFAAGALNFVMSVNRATNLLDGLFFQPG